jgi:hypothetical protein
VAAVGPYRAADLGRTPEPRTRVSAHACDGPFCNSIPAVKLQRQDTELERHRLDCYEREDTS